MAERERILVVDDEQAIRKTLHDFLQRKGYDVEMAQDGREAIYRLKRKVFDLVITDLMMPEVDGMAVLMEAKALPYPPEVIILTGQPSFDSAIPALREYGAYDYLIKPYDFAEIALKIGKALEKKRLIRENLVLKEVASIHEATRALTLAHNMDDLLRLIMEYSFRLTGAESGSIMLMNDTRDGLVVKFVRGRKTGKVPEVGTTLSSGIAWWVARHGESVLIRGEEIIPPIDIPLKTDWDFGSAISLPLMTEEAIKGVVNLNRSADARSFDEVDLQIASVLAMQVGVAIENTILASQLKEKITELEDANRKIEETYRHLAQAEKLSTIGLMAGTVAHDINNPLSVISGRVQLLLMKADPSSREAQVFQIIMDQVEWINTLIKSLSTYSRKSKGERQPTSLVPCIENALVLTQHLLDENGIQLERIFNRDLPDVLGNANELEQVFMNLIQNAVQAMKTGGKLTIEVSPDDMGQVCTRVSDTGVGIPERVLDKIFEPFYTTKEEGEGTGLGLLICKRIVDGHHGTIEVMSEVGRGTTFLVKIPGV